MKYLIFMAVAFSGFIASAQSAFIGQWNGNGTEISSGDACAEPAYLDISMDMNVMEVWVAQLNCGAGLKVDYRGLEFHIDNGQLYLRNKLVGNIHGGRAFINLELDGRPVVFRLNVGMDGVMKILVAERGDNARAWEFNLRK